MIVVVADTSPLNYLIQIKCDQVLPALYESILIPSKVLEELRDQRSPESVRVWLKNAPPWLVVEQVADTLDDQLARLDPGERQAIQLAKQAQADLLLMDEKLGVRIAREHGLAVTGTLGVLLQAFRHSLLDLEEALTALQATDFRCSRRVMDEVRRRASSS